MTETGLFIWIICSLHRKHRLLITIAITPPINGRNWKLTWQMPLELRRMSVKVCHFIGQFVKTIFGLRRKISSESELFVLCVVILQTKDMQCRKYFMSCVCVCVGDTQLNEVALDNRVTLLTQRASFMRPTWPHVGPGSFAIRSMYMYKHG